MKDSSPSKKKLAATALFLFPLVALSAQSHNTIPVTETALYEFLEIARIRRLTGPIRATKPYARSLAAAILYEIEGRKDKLSAHEQTVLEDLIERYAIDADKAFNLDGDVRFSHDIFPTTFGAYVRGEMSIDVDKEDSLGANGLVGAYIKGDIGKHVSWGMDATAGGFLVDDYDVEKSYGPEGWIPYSYTKIWDGGLHPIAKLDSFEQMPTSPSVGYSYSPEIAASFWDNRVGLRFGRIRHNWGIGEGSLHLDPGARPFFAFEWNITPFKQVSISSIAGILEYGENFRKNDAYHIEYTSRKQQNMFSALQVEVTPLDWLYLSFFDGVVYLKRPEWGYVFPLMSKFFSQNNTGDFDNLMMGGTIGLSWPGFLRAYFSVYLDEARFTAGDFFHNPANMYSFQAGIKAPIPGIPWSTLTLQYTKIEPFTYTHYYYVDSPWYTPPVAFDEDGSTGERKYVPVYAMDTGYMNGGESLGYGLEPNSDEIMLKLTSHFRRGITWSGEYRMIRHGFPESVPGSTFDPWGFSPKKETLDPDKGPELVTPGNDPNGAYGGTKKSFLCDGIYEWFHIVTLGGTLDTRLWNEAVQFGLQYSFVALYYTDFKKRGNFKPINSSYYPNTFRNIVTISIGVSPY